MLTRSTNLFWIDAYRVEIEFRISIFTSKGDSKDANLEVICPPFRELTERSNNKSGKSLENYLRGLHELRESCSCQHPLEVT